MSAVKRYREEFIVVAVYEEKLIIEYFHVSRIHVLVLVVEQRINVPVRRVDAINIVGREKGHIFIVIG